MRIVGSTKGIIVAVLGAALASGCMLFRAQEDLKTVELLTQITGTVEATTTGNPPVVVGLFLEENGRKSLARYYVRRGSGPFQFQVTAGSYHVFAWEDRNENLRYDEGEPAYYVGGRQAPLTATPGTKLDVGRIRLSTAVPAGIAELRAAARQDAGASPDLKRLHRGTLTNWDDPRFRPEAGAEGMWTPHESLDKYGAGIFFFESYDPARVPVVFVHGINDTAYGFKTVIDNLDRTRFQAWVFQYPSGARLDLISDILARILDELQTRYKIDRYAIVAHSLGGLVTRGAVNQIVQRGGANPIALYITISTPWEGHPAAEMGTKISPVVLPVWFDMSPGSPYLARLFKTQLPDTLPYYLFFGYEGGSGTDGKVTLQSMLDMAAQDQSQRIVAFRGDHMSVLQSKEVIDRLNALLLRHAARESRGQTPLKDR
ncbi:MAG TPA: alpha/beta fold hydrolase [Burkholderiales bacterium]|nr:alpha/beta fold hydrolase [Burkholderiales bacterium]